MLIVDDNVGLAENIAEILAFDGHYHGRRGKRRRGACAMALASDARGPGDRLSVAGINGADLVKQFWKMRTPVCAVVISAYTDERTMRGGHGRGRQIVAKPVDFGLLSQAGSRRRRLAPGG